MTKFELFKSMVEKIADDNGYRYIVVKQMCWSDNAIDIRLYENKDKYVPDLRTEKDTFGCYRIEANPATFGSLNGFAFAQFVEAQNKALIVANAINSMIRAYEEMECE